MGFSGECMTLQEAMDICDRSPTGDYYEDEALVIAGSVLVVEIRRLQDLLEKYEYTVY